MASLFQKYLLQLIQACILLIIYAGTSIVTIIMCKKANSTLGLLRVVLRRSRVTHILVLCALNWSMLAVYGIPTRYATSIKLRRCNVAQQDLCTMIIPVVGMPP